MDSYAEKGEIKFGHIINAIGGRARLGGTSSQRETRTDCGPIIFFIIIRQPGCFLSCIGRSEAPSNEESVCGVGVDRFTSASPQGGKGIVGRPVHYIKATGVVRLVVT